MKILYIGDYIKGNGPSSVDLNLKKSFTDMRYESIRYVQSTSFFLFIINKIYWSDVVHISGLSFLGVFSSIVGKFFFKKVTISVHGCLLQDLEIRKVKKYRIFFERILYFFADEVYPVSETLTKYLPFKKTFIIPNGISEVSTSKIDKTKFLITLIGGGRPEKRHLEVCETIFKINHEYGLNIKVNLFGETGKESDSINKFKFLFNSGFTEKEEVYKSLCESNIFIQYSEFESFSLSVIDAIQRGCKVITSNNVGVNEFIEEGVGFEIVSNKEELEYSIIKMLNVNEDFEIKHSLLSWGEVAEKYIECWFNLNEK